MTDNNEVDSSSGSAEISEMELARQVRMLGDLEPGRDLWQGIQRRILDHPQQTRRGQAVWMPYAVAASLFLAISAISLNLFQATRTPAAVSQPVSLEEIQQDYLKVRNPMVEQFGLVNRRLDDKTRSTLFENLEIIAQARREIALELREHPENQRLREMLLRLHEQELALLKRDFTTPSLPGRGDGI